MLNAFVTNLRTLTNQHSKTDDQICYSTQSRLSIRNVENFEQMLKQMQHFKDALDCDKNVLRKMLLKYIMICYCYNLLLTSMIKHILPSIWQCIFTI